MKAFEIVEIMESWAPSHLTDSWDNTGLQVGDPLEVIRGIAIAMDVTDIIVDLAIKNDCNMIISHHPFIFSPLKSLRMDDYKGRLIKKIIKNDLVVYNAHTNLDLANGGINDELARLFGIVNSTYLKKSSHDDLVKLAIYVPKENRDDIFEALSESGAGHIGNYSDCSFSTEGTGRFIPGEGTSPHIGSFGNVEKVLEVKIETIITKDKLSKTIENVKRKHPYEEIPLDIYPLHNKGNSYGYGRIGDIQELSLVELVQMTKEKLKIDSVRVYGNLEEKITRIAVCGGAGADFIEDAAKKNAQAYITGDIKYHDAQYAYEKGIILIDGTHFGTEKIILPVMEERLREQAEENIKVIVIEDRSFDFRTY